MSTYMISVLLWVTTVAAAPASGKGDPAAPDPTVRSDIPMTGQETAAPIPASPSPKPKPPRASEEEPGCDE